MANPKALPPPESLFSRYRVLLLTVSYQTLATVCDAMASISIEIVWRAVNFGIIILMIQEFVDVSYKTLWCQYYGNKVTWKP